MNGTLTIRASEKTRSAYASASRHHREIAERRFAEVLETPEQELIQEPEAFGGNASEEETFVEFAKRFSADPSNKLTLESVDKVAAKMRAETEAYIAEIGLEAWAKELAELMEGGGEEGYLEGYDGEKAL